nr:prepilin-type N-terminal cleavage/methylation domain-containing protein [uncultured Tolumonas sp.]
MLLNKDKGFSLIELMIAMVVGLFVAAIVATMYVNIVRANSTTIQLSRLNMDVQAALDVMARDVQRAGYVSGAEAALYRDASGNPVSSAVYTTVSLASFSAFTIVSGALSHIEQDLGTYQNSGDCILLRYDANGDGSIAGDTPPEIMGYRYNKNLHTIEYNSWNSIANQSCSANGEWGILAGGDGHVDITGLTFSILPTSGASSTFHQRSILITVSSASSRDAALHITLEKEVRLRNDQFIE